MRKRIESVLVKQLLIRFNAHSSTLQVFLIISMKNRKKHFIPNFELRSVVLLSALVLGAGTSALAQSTAAPLGAAPQASSAAGASVKDLDEAFAKADTNKDGKLDKQEAAMMPALADKFDQLDTNTDGSLSREEFSKAGS